MSAPLFSNNSIVGATVEVYAEEIFEVSGNIWGSASALIASGKV